jgi:hypothetical protein
MLRDLELSVGVRATKEVPQFDADALKMPPRSQFLDFPRSSGPKFVLKASGDCLSCYNSTGMTDKAAPWALRACQGYCGRDGALL